MHPPSTVASIPGLPGLVEVNPPFDEDLVLRAADFCQSCLEEAELGDFVADRHFSCISYLFDDFLSLRPMTLHDNGFMTKSDLGILDCNS